MASINRRPPSPVTHEGGKASRISPFLQLKRSVMACLLWEDTFYEDGEAIADRIASLCSQVSPEEVKALASEAKHIMNLRHVPLWMAVNSPKLLRDREFLNSIITRVDDMGELLSLYWLTGKKPIPKQMKRAFELACNKFDAYQFGKYRGERKSISVRDVLRLAHPRPYDDEHQRIFKAIKEGNLETPLTWETELSSGKDKKKTFEFLISENKLGALALLRNLRNMRQAGVENIPQGIKQMNTRKIIPFQFFNAMKYAPEFESLLEEKFFSTLKGWKKLPGRTILLVDNSGSMYHSMAGNSKIERIEAAGALAAIVREICEEVLVISFSTESTVIPDRRGCSLRDAILRSPSGGTYLGKAIKKASERPHDRLIVITDEQAHDNVPAPKKIGYILNVASYANGVGYGSWTHIDGWSSGVLRYIYEKEGLGDPLRKEEGENDE